jgi:hypothetical protein
VVNDRRASIDYESQVKPLLKETIQTEFKKNSQLPISFFPADSSSIQDTTKLTIVVAEPDKEWMDSEGFKSDLSHWIKSRGTSPRLYPAALIWCFKKQGRELRDKAEVLLAWKQVNKEYADGLLGSDMSSSDIAELRSKLVDSENAVKDEIWASYRYIALYTKNQENHNLHIIDLGQGHSSASISLSDRIITALKSQAILNESVGIGYLERYWPQAFIDKGAWPLKSLRQSFLDGSLTRLADPDAVLKSKIHDFVYKGDAGLISSSSTDGQGYHLWFKEDIDPSEIMFVSEVSLVMAKKVDLYKPKDEPGPQTDPNGGVMPPEPEGDGQGSGTDSDTDSTYGQGQHDPQFELPRIETIKLSGELPYELWNKFSRSVLTKLNASSNGLIIKIDIKAETESNRSENIKKELLSGIQEVKLDDKIKIT